MKIAISVIAFAAAFFIFKYAVGGLTGGQPSAGAPITGAVRSEFVQAGNATCLDAQRKLSENAGLPTQLLAEYCGCYMNALADSVSNAEVAAVGREQDKTAALSLLKDRTVRASNQCISSMQSKVDAARR